MRNERLKRTRDEGDWGSRSTGPIGPFGQRPSAGMDTGSWPWLTWANWIELLLIFLCIYIDTLYIQIFFAKIMGIQLHTLEYKWARPCQAVHVYRLPAASC